MSDKILVANLNKKDVKSKTKNGILKKHALGNRLSEKTNPINPKATTNAKPKAATNVKPKADTNTKPNNKKSSAQSINISCKKRKSVIILDPDIKTLYPSVIKVYKEWINICPSLGDLSIQANAVNMISDCKKYVLQACNANEQDYTVFFTTGMSESNILILHSAIFSYKKLRGVKPHVIVSTIEHSSIIESVRLLEEGGHVDITFVNPNIFGCVLAETVESAIRVNTCMISIMYANHELGAVNNIPKIGEIAHRHKIPIHSDCSYIFGKYNLDLSSNTIDSITAAFDVIHGPKVGILIINNNFLNGYKLQNDVYLNQKIKNIPTISSIAASYEALNCTLKNRTEKNTKLLKMRNLIISKLGKVFKLTDYISYMKHDTPTIISESDISSKKKGDLIILGPHILNESYYIPNIISFAIIAKKESSLNNIKIKELLYDSDIIVGLPKCINNSETFYIQNSIKSPKNVQKNTICISIKDTTTSYDIDKFTNSLIKILK
jgi:hypothetical protein